MSFILIIFLTTFMISRTNYSIVTTNCSLFFSFFFSATCKFNCGICVRCTLLFAVHWILPNKDSGQFCIDFQIDCVGNDFVATIMRYIPENTRLSHTIICIFFLFFCYFVDGNKCIEEIVRVCQCSMSIKCARIIVIVNGGQ